MKVYYNPSLVTGEYISFLAPLLGCPSFSIRGENPAQIQDRYNSNPDLILSNEKECNYFVFPKYFLLDHFDELAAYNKLALSYGKKVLVFSYGEIDDYFNISDNILWFKRSTLKSNPSNEFCLPAFPENLGKHSKSHTFKSQGKYSIGFTGYSSYYNLSSYIHYLGVRVIGLMCRTTIGKKILLSFKREALYNRFVNAGIGNYCRGKVVNQLRKSKTFIFNFIQRKKALTSDIQGTLRKEYIENLGHSDFTLIVRGFGNYSIRLYEALSLGKIPVYIDTCAKLPFENEINYNDIFVIVPFSDINNIETYIKKFISQHPDLHKVQDKILDIYNTYLTMASYYNHIIQTLASK